MPPHFIGDDAEIENAYVTEGCHIEGKVYKSILFPGVNIERDATVSNSIIMNNSTIQEEAVVEYAIIAPEANIGKGSKIGVSEEQDDEIRRKSITVIGQGYSTGDHIEVKVGDMVPDNISEKEEGDA